ncbi:MAG: transcription antitermination factor NusB [Mycoplasmatales bacterium]
MRKMVFEILKEFKEEKTYLNLKLKNLKYDDNKIRNITIRVYGVVQNFNFLEFKILEVSKDKKLDQDTKIVLMMALFEKMYLDSVPDYALISEYTNLAHRFTSKSVKYISFFLNNKLQEAEESFPEYGNELKNISIIYSHPLWVVKKLEKQYPENFLDIIKANLRKKVITARVVKNLQEENLFTKVYYNDLVKCSINVLQTNDFKNGNIIIQDFGSYLVTKFLDPKKKDIVLDMCAAPGNKTLHIAQTATEVYANEINLKRFELLKRNVKKNDFKNITVINYDASDSKGIGDFLKTTKFDKILIDAPCSGWGVFRSKPDIKVNQNVLEVERLKKIQQKILLTAYNFLKPGGELVYSTCTINKEENEEQIIEFLKHFQMKEIKDNKIKEFSTKNKYGYTLTPDLHKSDGFYMCKLKKGYDE